MLQNSACASWLFCFSSGNALHCIILLPMASLKHAVFCSIVTLMWRRRLLSSNYFSHAAAPIIIICLFYEAKVCLRKLILLLPFSRCTPLHKAAADGHLEVCRLLLQFQSSRPVGDMDFASFGLQRRRATPLHYSAEKGHLEVCRFLLQKQFCNADLRATDPK